MYQAVQFKYIVQPDSLQLVVESDELTAVFPMVLVHKLFAGNNTESASPARIDSFADNLELGRENCQLSTGTPGITIISNQNMLVISCETFSIGVSPSQENRKTLARVLRQHSQFCGNKVLGNIGYYFD